MQGVENLVELVNVYQIKNTIRVDFAGIIHLFSKIIGVDVIHNKIVVQKFRRCDVQLEFLPRSGSGLYCFYIFCEDSQSNRKTIIINFNYETPHILSNEQLSDLISIELVNGAVAYNAIPLEEYTTEIIGCYLYFQNELIEKVSSTDYIFRFVLSFCGDYKIRLDYIDINGIKQSIINIVKNDYVINRNFSKNNLTLTKNYKSLFNIVYAFIIREFQRKYDKGYFRYFSVVLGPGIQLAIMVTVFSLMGRKSILGLSIPLFILTGMLPYNFFTAAGNCLTIISANQSLLSYKQVKIIDTIISSVVMELLVTLAVFLLGLGLCWYFNLTFTLYNPLSLIFSFVILFFMTFGLSMILAVVGFYFAEFNYAIQVVFRALFYVSGVFFSVEIMPVQYQKYFLWNPILQLIEFIRFAFVGFKVPYDLSYFYVLFCTFICFFVGLSLYFVNRNKFMINDRARV